MWIKAGNRLYNAELFAFIRITKEFGIQAINGMHHYEISPTMQKYDTLEQAKYVISLIHTAMKDGCKSFEMPSPGEVQMDLAKYDDEEDIPF